MERFDYIDPRIFLVLPEHVSNAHHIWNCALFLTQLSHLDASSSNPPKNAYQTDSLKLNSYLKSIANPNSRKLDEEYFDYSTNKSSSSSLSSKLNQANGDEGLKNLNEPIMKIFKIKKRNKASLFNLILPFSQSQNATNDYSCYYDNRNIINDIFNYKLFSNNLTTTPWMQLAVPPAAPLQTESAQTQVSLESNKTLRLEDEEYNDDETDSNDTEELELENSGSQAISLNKIQDSSKRNDLLDDDDDDGKKDASSASSSSSGSSSNENEDMNARTLSNSANVSNLDFNEGCKR